jgi:signal transduction histidine kinase
MLAALFPIIGSTADATAADTVIRSGNGADWALHFTDFETVVSNTARPPAEGWQRGHVDEVILDWILNPEVRRINLMWGRLQFDKRQLGPGAVGLFTEGNREQIIIWLNGKEIFRNFSHGDLRRVEGWYRAYFVPIPRELLREGANEIVIRADSDAWLSIGKVKIGAAAPLLARKAYLQFWRVDAAMAANVAMLLLSVAALAAWLFRRGDGELLYLGLSGLLWFARNYPLFMTYQIYHPPWPARISLLLSYVAPVASAAFCLHFIDYPKRGIVLGGTLSFGVAVWLATIGGLNPKYGLFWADVAVGIAIPLFILFGHNQKRTMEHWGMASILAFVSLASFHDVIMLGFKDWAGLGFFVYGYFGLFIAFGFLLLFGRRALMAFADLELRVTEANQTLRKSEEKRRELEVAQAIDSERTRLMREMHDGIGSNLVTALAVAEQQQQPTATIKTLKRAISDLKITVDSLEPIEGDLVALLANLRHRMARDLKEAGLVCRWKAEPCPPLPWLDATNALHVLRICQEAISNVLAHADATELEIGCAPIEHQGRAGLCAWVTDNGKGFCARRFEGKGLKNMQSRTEALHGVFECKSEPLSGTHVTIWLPIHRLADGDKSTKN